MDAVRHRRVVVASGILSAVALALVFAAALRAVPAGLLPRAPDAVLSVIPHVNAVLVAVAFVVVARGWRRVRAGDVASHRRAMLVGLALFAAFLVLYLYRVALLGPTEFGGPAWLYRFVYLPMLAIHVLLAMICVPLLTYVAMLGLTVSVPELPSTPHPRVGRVAAALWLVSFALGDAVYLLLYWR